MYTSRNPNDRKIRWENLEAGEEAIVTSLQALNASIRKLTFTIERIKEFQQNGQEIKSN